eukprot:Amastigsp_a850535_8.p2 type:complete len:136 gc:universal Amastigsp_a850535_8:586-179(-)
MPSTVPFSWVPLRQSPSTLRTSQLGGSSGASSRVLPLTPPRAVSRGQPHRSGTRDFTAAGVSLFPAAAIAPSRTPLRTQSSRGAMIACRACIRRAPAKTLAGHVLPMIRRRCESSENTCRRFFAPRCGDVNAMRS